MADGNSVVSVYDVPAEWSKRAWIDDAKYREMYARSLSDPDGFWAEQGKRIDWMKPFSKVSNCSFEPRNISIKWFEDGTTNVAWNCIDRHLPKRANQVAIVWEGDDPNESKEITYAELAREVATFANVLKSSPASGRRGRGAAMLAPSPRSCARSDDNRPLKNFT